MIALFDPGHLPMQDGHRALLWPYNSVVVQFWRYKFTRVVQLELDIPNATKMPISSILVRKDITRMVALFVWLS